MTQKAGTQTAIAQPMMTEEAGMQTAIADAANTKPVTATTVSTLVPVTKDDKKQPVIADATMMPVMKDHKKQPVRMILEDAITKTT